LATAVKTSAPGASSIFTVVIVDVIVTVIAEVSVNCVLFALVSEGVTEVELAVNVYGPAMENFKLAKAATPPAAVTVVVDVGDANKLAVPAGERVEAIVTGAFEPAAAGFVTTLLKASSTPTVTWVKGVTFPPKGAFAGCTRKASLVAAPGTIVMAVLGLLVSAGAALAALNA
jgi:hypothetical protein